MHILCLRAHCPARRGSCSFAKQPRNKHTDKDTRANMYQPGTKTHTKPCHRPRHRLPHQSQVYPPPKCIAFCVVFRRDVGIYIYIYMKLCYYVVPKFCTLYIFYISRVFIIYIYIIYRHRYILYRRFCTFIFCILYILYNRLE